MRLIESVSTRATTCCEWILFQLVGNIPKAVGHIVIGNAGDDYRMLANFIREELGCGFVCVVQANTNGSVGEYCLQFRRCVTAGAAIDLADVLQNHRQSAVGTADDS